MLTYYTAKELLRIIKSIDTGMYKKIKHQSKDTQRYLGNLYLNAQIGGVDNDALGSIQNVNNEIRMIVSDVVSNVMLIRDQLKFTQDENVLLKQQIAKLQSETVNMDIDQCTTEKVEDYITKFLDVKRILKRFTEKVEEISSKNLKISPDIVSQESIDEYNTLYQNIKADTRVSKENMNCKNYEKIKDMFKSYNEANLFQRLLDDFEAISGTVRVFVRILNRSTIDESKMWSGKQVFAETIIPRTNANKIKTVNRKIVETCGTSKCLSLPSIIADNRYVKRTKYPCSNDSNQLIQFKYRYGPFFTVFENKRNNEVFAGNDEQIGMNTIIKQVKSGVNTVVFSYGLSGSGKSHSILGSNTEYGMVQLTLKQLEPILESISMNIYELYGKMHVSGTKTLRQWNVSRKIIDYGQYNLEGGIDTIIKEIQHITKVRREENRIKFTTNNPDSSRGHLFIKLNITLKNGKTTTITFIDSAGVEDPFVIARTFLHIDQFSIKYLSRKMVKTLITDITNDSLLIKSTFWDEKFVDSFLKQNKWARGYLTRRNNKINTRDVPLENKRIVNKIIKYLYLESLRTEIIKNDQMFEKLFGSLDYEDINMGLVIDYIWDMFTEGLFINETLNHLRIYMQKRIGRKITFNEKSSGTFDYNTVSASEYRIGGDRGYDPSKLLQDPMPDIKNKNIMTPEDINNSSSVGMISFLKYLNVSKSTKPTKYVLLMNIRTDLDDSICNGAKQTLDFANSVKST